MSSDRLRVSQASVSPVQEKTLTYWSKSNQWLVAGECGEGERAGFVQPAEDKAKEGSQLPSTTT